MLCQLPSAPHCALRGVWAPTTFNLNAQHTQMRRVSLHARIALRAPSRALVARQHATTAPQETTALRLLLQSCRAHLAATRAAPTWKRQTAATCVQRVRRAPRARRRTHPALRAHTQTSSDNPLARSVPVAHTKMAAARRRASHAMRATSANTEPQLRCRAQAARFRAPSI